MPDYYKSIQITLTEEEYADIERACALRIAETGSLLSVTRYAKVVLLEEVYKQITRRNDEQ